MKKIFLAWYIFCSILGTSAQAAESPCYFGGDYVKCFPQFGINLTAPQVFRLTEDPGQGTDSVEIAAPDLAATWTMTLPPNHGTLGQTLIDGDGAGTLSWADAGATLPQVHSIVNGLGSKQVADLVCHAQTTLSGIQTCDGQSTSGASIILAVAQTDPTENGLWQVDDFLGWTRTSGFSVATIPGSIIGVDEIGGGTTYQDTLWYGHGDSNTTGNYYAVPTTAGNTLLTASRALVTDSNNHLAAATTTATEIGYVNGVTSAIQTQLNTKSTNPGTTTGDIDYCSNTATPCTLARLGIGVTGTVLHGGVTPSYTQIVDADVDAAAAIAGTKIVAAASTVPGVVSASTQTFTGVKTFETGITAGVATTLKVTVDSTTTGAAQNLAHPTPFIYVTNASLTSLISLTSSSVTDGTVVTLVNKTGGVLTLVDQSGAVLAGNDQIFTGSAANATIQPNGSATFILNHASALGWFVKSLNAGILGLAQGGTSAGTKSAAFNALSPMTTQGDIIYGGTSGTGTRLGIGGANTVLHGGSSIPAYSAVDLNSADVTNALPIGNGGTGQTAKTAAFDALQPMTTAGDMIAGGTSGTGTRVATGLIGNISASILSQAYTVTSATPGVFTISAHGFVTGQTGYVTVTQNGFTLNTTYYIHKIDANTFHLSSSFSNLVTATYLASSGTTAGSFVTGGLVNNGNSATVTSANATGVSNLGLQTYYYSTGNSDRTFTTPAVGTSNGTHIRLVKTDTGTGKVTVSTTDGSLIGPSNTSTLFAQGAATELDCDGSNWYVTQSSVNVSSTASTFTFNGTGSPGTTGSVTLVYTRIGDWVTLFVPLMSAATGTAGTNQLIANTAIAAWARPAGNNNYPLINVIKDNGAQQATPGVALVQTNGLLDILRDGAGTAFTGAGTSAGLALNGNITYYVGTGS